MEIDEDEYAYPPTWGFGTDGDYTSPYPCCTCGREFKSRYLLATHEHSKQAAR